MRKLLTKEQRNQVKDITSKIWVQIAQQKTKNNLRWEQTREIEYKNGSQKPESLLRGVFADT